jgi:TIR domain
VSPGKGFQASRRKRPPTSAGDDALREQTNGEHVVNLPSTALRVGPLKVFLSYSRSDAAFAQELLIALETLGFDAYLDRQDIAPGEPWQERLANLIRAADTVVYILSPASLMSTHCGWEVEEAVRASKKLVPVLKSRVPDSDVPLALRKLNYVEFLEGMSFAKGVADLARALRADVAWLREHTRYGEMALRWRERDASPTLLLRGTDLDEARRWAAARPVDAPEISGLQLEFLEASRKSVETEVRDRARTRLRVTGALAVLALASTMLAVTSLFYWRAAATAGRSLATTNAELTAAKTTLSTQNAELLDQRARLERPITLRIASLGLRGYDVPAGWFQIATRYADKIAFVERASAPGRPIGSAALVRARLLDPRWGDETALVTANYIVTGKVGAGGSSVPIGDAVIVLVGPRGERHVAKLGRLLWESDKVGVAIATVEGPLPDGATVIEQIASTARAVETLPELTRSQIDALFDEDGVVRAPGDPRPVVFVGNLPRRSEVALSIGHLLARRSTAELATAGVPNVISQSASRAPVLLRADLAYTYASFPGSGGTPIFDAETGDLLGIHLVWLPCANPRNPQTKCAGGGASMARILAAIRDGDAPE